MQDKKPERFVIGQHPPAGMQVPKGSAINFIVSAQGSVPNTFTPMSPEDLETRFTRWVSLSVSPALLKAQGVSWFYSITIQQLAHLDRRLIEYDQAIALLSGAQKREPNRQKESFEHLGLSTMWVTMGFQAIYVMDKQQKIHFPGLGGCLRCAKERFVRLRSPFAHNAPQNDDFPFPYMGGLIPGSAAWVVDDHTTISRLELADVLLTVLTRVAQLSL